ncbi:General transcription factor II-I repeat domain-containing protein 2A [Nosema granulosis]|uniref:General transcription factor II-I repeat domain-containing protein 2A n=1 Tax=Nosema granulosis TaxID=83296 RepID=A0A9P6GZC5_9MICR|nr:General transcription factor II-I repeat domain-containing protein 2A [Nosema granulosis]
MFKRELNYVKRFIIFPLHGKEIPQLREMKWIRDPFCLVDLTKQLNKPNTNLQRKDRIVVNLYGRIRLFSGSVNLWSKMFKRDPLYRFSKLSKLTDEIKEEE